MHKNQPKEQGHTHNNPTVDRHLLSKVYFALMVGGVLSGIGLPALWHGLFNIVLISLGVYSGYKLLRGPTF